MTDFTNMELDSGGTNELTVYVDTNRDQRQKKNTNFTPPQGKSNRASGPKQRRVLDLLNVKRTLRVIGHIDEADVEKLVSMHDSGGTFEVTWDSKTVLKGQPALSNGDFTANFENLTFTTGRRDDAHRGVDFTLVDGTDL